jgi:hypothetical protein
MAVLGRLLIGSQQRIDLPDFLSLQSYVASDFKELVRSFVGDRALILKGFEIIDAPQSIGNASISIKVSDSVLYHPGSSAGSFFYGLPDGNALSAPLVPELRTNTVNYVYVTLSTVGAGQDTRAFWDVDLNGGQGGEFNQDINTEAVLIAQVGVSTSGFPEGTVPVAAIEMNNTSIVNITDSRNMMFRLGTGGVSPNSNATFQFPPLPSTEYARNEPPSTIQNSSSPSPFFGGDKNIQTLKDWMDAVMTKLLELSGTTYWYETTQALNLVNIFDDALGSSIKSKGRWSHDESTPGLVTWSEDILYRKMNDKRDIIIRANPTTGAQLSNEQVMWIQMNRNESINPLDTPVQFANSVSYVNGVAGDFSNLNLGDWIKRRGDNENLYVRVVGFKDGTSGGGSDTTPSLAASVILEEPYGGSTALDTAVYTKGVYENVDIQINNRNDAASYTAGGDFYWLANRSDTVMDVASINATYLTDVDVSDSDGKRAKLTFSSPHGLTDGDRIVVANASAYNGTYLVDVESTAVVSIETTATTNPSNITVSWAIVTTQARDVGSQGFEVESGTHGFASNQTVFIANTSSAYDTYNSGKYLINVRSASTFQIPYNANTNVGAVGTATCAKVILKTELGAVEVVQGESIDINKPDAVNIMQYIGMDSLAQTTPNYFLPQSYNALAGFANYNADATDDLTARAAKLTAMMADRVQDRDSQLLGRVTIRNESDTIVSSDQVITWSGSLSILLPGTGQHDIFPPGGNFTLSANKALTATLNRNVSYETVTAQIESLDSSFEIGENKIILLYRLASAEIYTWDGSTVPNSGSWTSNDYDTSQNKNIVVHDEAGVNYTGAGFVYYNTNGYVRIIIPGSNVTNEIDTTAINTLYPTGFAVGNNKSVWVRINRRASKTFNTVQTSASYQDTDAAGALYVTNNQDVPTDQDVVVLYTAKNGALIKLRHDFQIGNIYDEDKLGVLGAPSNSNEFQAPKVSGNTIYLPNDSRNDNSTRYYIVGSGQLEMFLNGQRMKRGEDYNEYGTIDSASSQIEILQDLVAGDVLSFRIGSIGGMYTTPQSFSTTTLQQAYNNNNIVAVTAGSPVTLNVPGGVGKALSITGDMAITGVIDPAGIEFTPQAANPLALGQNGLWVDTSGNLKHTRPGFVPDTVNITNAIVNPTSFLTEGNGIDITGSTVSVDLATNPGLEFATGKLRAKVPAGGALTLGATGISLNLDANSMELSGSNLSVNLDPAKAIVADVLGAGIGVNLATSNPGLAITANQLDVKLDDARAITSGTSGIGVNLEGTNPTLKVDTNQLGVKLNAAGAVVTGASGIGVQLEVTNPSLKITTNRLGVNLDTSGAIVSAATGIGINLETVDPGLKITSNKLDVKLDAARAVTSGASGIGVNLNVTNPGLVITANALDVKLDGSRAITSGASGVGVNLETVNPTLQVSTNQLGVKLNAAGAITTGANGLGVAVDGSTIQIQSNQLVVSGVPNLLVVFTNNTGTLIPVGAVVAADTTTNQIVLASASTLPNALKTIGVAYQNIANGSTGQVQIAGVATVATSSLTVGQAAYLSTVSAGVATGVRPTSYGTPVFSLGTAVANNKIVLQPKAVGVNASVYQESDTQVSTVSSGTTLTLPVDSRASNAIRYYTVGAGFLTVYLNGQKLLLGDDYLEVGTAGTDSNQITIQQDLDTGDVLEYRIDASQALFKALSLL